MSFTSLARSYEPGALRSARASVVPLVCAALAWAIAGLFTLPSPLGAASAPRLVHRAAPHGVVCFADAPHGMRRYDVYATLGAPTCILAPDIWAYTGCTTDDPVARANGYDTMVLTFSGDRLTSKRLVSGAALRAALRAAEATTSS